MKPMRRSLRCLTFSVALSAALFVLGAADDAPAQTPPAAGAIPPSIAQLEIFGGYSSVRANMVSSGTQLNLKGASLSAAFDVNHWLGLVCDMGLYHQGNVAGSGFSLTVQSYQFGPRLSWRNRTRLTPFGQFLLGAGNAVGTLYTSSIESGMPPLGSSNSFVFTIGGGADWRLSPRIGIRLVQAESLQSHFLNGSGNGNRQSSLRLSSGLVFSFGNN
jgi:hypothetical protein